MQRVFGVFKFNSTASTESASSNMDDFSPPQRMRGSIVSGTNTTPTTSSTTSSPTTTENSHHPFVRSSSAPNTSQSKSHQSSSSSVISNNTSPSTSPKHSDDDACHLNTVQIEGNPSPLDNFLVKVYNDQQNSLSSIDPTPNQPNVNHATHQTNSNNNSGGSLNSSKTRGLSQTPVYATSGNGSRKRLPNGTLIRPYHHYKMFYCGDNRYNLLSNIAVDQFILSRSTRLYKIGKSAPVDKLALNSSNRSITKTRPYTRQGSAKTMSYIENTLSTRNLANGSDSQLPSLYSSEPVEEDDDVLFEANRNSTSLEDLDIEAANSYSVSSSLLDTVRQVPLVGQQIFSAMNDQQDPISLLSINQQNTDEDCHEKYPQYSYDEKNRLDITPAISTTTIPGSNIPTKTSFNKNYLSPFASNTSNNSAGSQNPFESISSSSSSDSQSNISMNSLSASNTSFIEGIETTVIHPIDMYQLLATSSKTSLVHNVPAVTSKTTSQTLVADNLSEEIIFIATGFDSTYFLSHSGRVWSCGENSCHQLGHDSNELAEIPNIQFLNIKEIYSRGEHTLFLSQDNISLYACGNNKQGQCGVGSELQQISTVTPVAGKIGSIQQVVCGYDHTVVLTADYQVYMCGDNTDYQLGGTFPQNINILTRLDTSTFTKSRIVKIQAGDYHTILLSANGEVFVSGSNNYGEIGSFGPKQFFSLQTELIKKFGACICDILSNSLTSYFRDVQGNVYVMGDNQYGHAAVGYAMDVIPPTRSEILSDPDIVDINVGKCHLVYTKRSRRSPQDVEVYSVGLNEFNQLGIESVGIDDHYTTPVRLLDLETIYQYQRKRWRTKHMNIVCSTYSTIFYFTQRNETEVVELLRLLMLRLVLPDKWLKAVDGLKKLEMGFDLDVESDKIWKFNDITITTTTN